MENVPVFKKKTILAKLARGGKKTKTCGHVDVTRRVTSSSLRKISACTVLKVSLTPLKATSVGFLSRDGVGHRPTESDCSMSVFSMATGSGIPSSIAGIVMVECSPTREQDESCHGQFGCLNPNSWLLKSHYFLGCTRKSQLEPCSKPYESLSLQKLVGGSDF